MGYDGIPKQSLSKYRLLLHGCIHRRLGSRAESCCTCMWGMQAMRLLNEGWRLQEWRLRLLPWGAWQRVPQVHQKAQPCHAYGWSLRRCSSLRWDIFPIFPAKEIVLLDVLFLFIIRMLISLPSILIRIGSLVFTVNRLSSTVFVAQSMTSSMVCYRIHDLIDA